MSVDTPQQAHLLLKIVLGAAWVDGALQPTERAYLQDLLAFYGEAGNAELRALTEHPVLRAQTEAWMVAYLQEAGAEGRQKLLAALANMLFADERISPVERELLDEYYAMMEVIPVHETHEDLTTHLFHALSGFLKKVFHKLGQG